MAAAGNQLNGTVILKIIVGAFFVLVALGAEIRLNFGLRFDMIVTLVAIWGYWHFCFNVRRRGGIS
jgi:hypothetical protein